MKYSRYKEDIGLPESTFPENNSKTVITSKQEYEDYLGAKTEFEAQYDVSTEEWKHLEEAFEECVRALKESRREINKTCEALDWRYFDVDHTITIDNVIDTARYLFQSICDDNNGTQVMSTGGVTVRANVILGEVDVHFAVFERSAYYDPKTRRIEIC